MLPTPADAPLFLAGAFAGFLGADAVPVRPVGTPALRRLCRAGEIRIIRGTGVLVLAVAVAALLQASPSSPHG